jgi:histidine ammonia-lyase
LTDFQTDSFVLGTPLTVADVIAVARQHRPVTPLADVGHDRVAASAAWVAGTLTRSDDGIVPAYYGINTGFGDNAGRAAFQSSEQAEQLSRNLLLSHCVGVGAHLPEDVVRAALLIRAQSLSHGYSGVRREVINTLVEMLNASVYPAVPAQGSLGASGDLAPLAHLVIPLSAPLPGEDAKLPGATGYCYVTLNSAAGMHRHLLTGTEAMALAGVPQIRLGAKEGVALINGTAVSTAIGTLALFDAERLFDWAQTSLALSLEAMRGFRDAFLPQINARRSPAQAKCAAQVLDLLDGSTLARGAANVDLPASDNPPQDPYSLRCAPAVMGAVRQTLDHVTMVIATELHAVTDNPLVFGDELPRETKIVSGSNFHGEPIAFAMDFLAIVVAEIGSISERRIFQLTDPRLNRGLPAFLIDEPPATAGLNSGLMIAQYTAASLVSENKGLCHPASVDSIPSSANREDHVSMSSIAARKAAQVIINARQVIALELLCAAQAVSLRLEQMPDALLGHGTEAAMHTIRSLEIAPGLPLDVIRHDVPPGPYVARLTALIKDTAPVS